MAQSSGPNGRAVSDAFPGRREASLDLDLPATELTARLCDIPSVSRQEKDLADAVERSLTAFAHLNIVRMGNTVVARTDLGRASRVVVAGHLDTVPVAGNLPTRLVDGVLHGRGTVDMKGGVAVALRLAAHASNADVDVTYLFYECEEIEAAANGLSTVARQRPDLLEADFAVLMEPTSAQVEGGCNGTLRARVSVAGVAAHSARSWMGSNAIHACAEVLNRLVAYRPRVAEVDGLVYREGLNAVGITGGIAGNVIPDRCVVTVNYRFAPDRSPAEAAEHVKATMVGFHVDVIDSAPGARPGLDRPAAAAFLAAVGGAPQAKQGWTDVALFSALGVPAVNYGPGDPALAHRDDEHVHLSDIEECERRMASWLTGSPSLSS